MVIDCNVEIAASDAYVPMSDRIPDLLGELQEPQRVGDRQRPSACQRMTDERMPAVVDRQRTKALGAQHPGTPSETASAA